MLNTKPSTCVNSHEKLRRVYSDRSFAKNGACHALSAHGNRMAPNRGCHGSSWHLRPTDRHTSSYYSLTCSKQVLEDKYDDGAQFEPLLETK